MSSPTLSSIRPLCLEPRAKRRGGRWVQVKRWGCDGKGGGALGPQVRAGLGWGLHPSPSSAVCSVVASLSSVGWAPALAQQRGLLLKAAVRGWGDKGCGMGEGAAKWRAGPWFACSLSSPHALWWTHLTCAEHGRSQPLQRGGDNEPNSHSLLLSRCEGWDGCPSTGTWGVRSQQGHGWVKPG